jgi:membrane protease YdiL (CAAX protease family)
LLAFIFVGNGVPGLVFGWLYWRRGLYAAMITHFGLDLVTKVLVPLVS